MEPKEVVGALQKEYDRVKAKSSTTDVALFNYISIGGVPFLAFTAYALVNPPYHILLAALPLLSILSAFVVLVLATHYAYVGAYSNYLENRINDYLGNKEFRDSQFSTPPYNDPLSPVKVFYFVGAVILIVGNVVAIPAINKLLARYLETHPTLATLYPHAIPAYWFLTTTFTAGALLLMVFGARSVSGKLKKLPVDILQPQSTNNQRQPTA